MWPFGVGCRAPGAGWVPEGGGEKTQNVSGGVGIMRKGNQSVLLPSPHSAIGLV